MHIGPGYVKDIEDWPRPRNKKEMGEVLSAHGKQMGEIKSNLAALSAQMAVMMETVKKSRVSGYRAPSRSPSPRRGGHTGMLPLGKWDISRVSAQSIWDRRKGRNEYLSMKLRRL